ncbi:hypothetical protein OJ997_23020 [Solirubrobacter phytolaccae]|uniref:Uncharacterized protein n=1 Tax=Solirubrobacter phytolaccae TaxID=1404360 RepID=A0A9X3SB36_9ACTN|nr:hypothetical protein [Solirubrobacter phytolaccae]MDA0183201.1 hypothetical protein [Solirubrobacter phytolaccae]
MNAFDVLERQLHDATTRRRRRRRAARPVLAIAFATAVAILALVLLDGGSGTQTPPADEHEVTAPTPAPQPVDDEVAFFSPDPDKIVYVRATSVDQDGLPLVTEDWHRGKETHRLVRWTDKGGKEWALDHVISADGVMRQINEEGGYRVIRRSDMEDARNAINQEQAGFLADFQRRFEEGSLDPVQREFAGRPALRYHVPHDPKRVGPVGPDQSYYVDSETGKPLGFTSAMRINPDQTMETTQTVDAIEVLEPTPENLDKLRTLTLQRRR